MIISALGLGFVACKPDGAESTGNAASDGKDLQPVIGAHLPEPTDRPAPDTGVAQSAQAVFAGGCFWCTEAVFEQLAGVTDVTSGYAGGDAATANYQAVSAGRTGHAEAIRITYDPTKITFGQLLKVFFATHDPTTLNRQGADVGTQYRSAIFFADDAQKRAAADYIAQINRSGVFDSPIVTKLEKLDRFYDAEDYHQDFAKNNPFHSYIRAVSDPKVKKVHDKFGDMVK